MSVSPFAYRTSGLLSMVALQLYEATAPPQKHLSCILCLLLVGRCAGLVAFFIANASVIISCTTFFFKPLLPRAKENPVCGGGGRLDPMEIGNQTLPLTPSSVLRHKDSLATF